MKRTILSILFTVLISILYGQTFRGQITSENGTPLPYAALYLREINSGFVTDDNGYFRTTLKPGKYTCEVSSLGYNKQTLTIEVPPEGVSLNIVLTEYVYQLKEVRITQSNEDPAHAVMRNAIANAPRFRYQVSRYSADTYLKGSGKLMDIPSVFMLSKEVRTEVNKYKNKTFLLEEERKVTYTAPNNWENEVIAYSNTFPEEITVLLETTDINLYAPRIFGKVSPLSAGAFSYYTYTLEGCVAEGEHLINKIKVTPKKENPELVSGCLYIVEDLWCLSGLDISFEGNGMKAGIKVNCNEVQPSLFLSTSITLETAFNLLGFKAEAAYLSSIKYREVEAAGFNFIASLTDSLSGISTREAYRLSRLIEKSIRETDSIKPKYKYERKPHSYQVKTDSLATKRDSMYWESVRSVPLNEEELASYAYKKNLVKDTLSGEKKSSNPGRELWTIFRRGKTYQTSDKKAWITFKNFWSIIPEYNLVDGLWLGTTFETGYKFNDQTLLKFTPYLYYVTARETWVGNGMLSLDYAPRRMGKAWISGGSFSEDFNRESGEHRLINSYASGLFGRNDIKFYDRKHITAGNRIELTNSLLFSSEFNWERRKTLTNSTGKTLFRESHVTPNMPGNTDYAPMPDNDLLKATVSLSYTPAHYYRMIQGKKVYENSSYPTFRVSYQQAFDHGGSSTSSPAFKKVELSIEQRIQFGLFNNLYWRVNGGLFWDKEDMYFPDFKHFAATRFPVTHRSFHSGFFLLDSYRMSTDSRWAQANITWSTPYLLIKQLPFLRRKAFDEALHFHTLFVDGRDCYTEAGYSVGFMNMGRIGVFAGFNKFDYHSVGVSVSIPIVKMLGY